MQIRNKNNFVIETDYRILTFGFFYRTEGKRVWVFYSRVQVMEVKNIRPARLEGRDNDAF
jgi:hypothetical protein